jgi:hypothetical protein
VRHDQDLPESLVVRMASSAAHVMGRPLASSESATWLRDHWKEALAYVKPELDRILAEGINHLFYHGTVFSPQDAPWPGWLFYASTQFNPNNPWWDDFAALNRYVGRVQSVLQRARPDNDLLLYWPAADVWEAADGHAKMLTVHHVDWLTGQPVGKLARQLADRGFTFRLHFRRPAPAETRVEQGALVTPGARYRAVVVPAARRLPVATLEKLVALARAGATVIFERTARGRPRPRPPRRTPRRLPRRPRATAGLRRHRARRHPRRALRARPPRNPRRHRAQFPPPRHPGGPGLYFVTNLTARNPSSAGSTLANAARYHRAQSARRKVRRRAQPLQRRQASSRSSSSSPRANRSSSAPPPPPVRHRAATRPGPLLESAGAPVRLAGTWTIEFLQGRPRAARPAPHRPARLLDRARRPRRATFRRHRPATALNSTPRPRPPPTGSSPSATCARAPACGSTAPTPAPAWSLPLRLRVGPHLRPGRNVLELDVTNLAANRIRDLDIRKGVAGRSCARSIS